MENLKAYLPESVKGKNILITGGTTGIGRAIAILFASQGAKILIFGRHEAELKDALKDIDAAGVDHEGLSLKLLLNL